ncbi:MAG: hypothetical protein ACO3RP_05895 [Flavobacteriaceae bacterium]
MLLHLPDPNTLQNELGHYPHHLLFSLTLKSSVMSGVKFSHELGAVKTAGNGMERSLLSHSSQ